MADLNGRTVSEVVAGEVINGGSGINTLYIYGTVDLTGVTLSNVTVLVVSSDVTLSADQMALFTTVNGDGTSTINIEVPPGDTYIIDLTNLDISDVGSLNIDGNVMFIIDTETDLDGINAINAINGSQVSLTVNGGTSGTTNVNLSDISDTFNDLDVIELDNDVTLLANNAADITGLGLSQINGAGEVDNGGNAAAAAAMEDVTVNTIYASQDNIYTREDWPLVISFDDLLANDHSDNPDDLVITNIELAPGSEDYVRIEVDYEFRTITVFPNPDQAGGYDLNYTISDGNGNTDVGLVHMTFNLTNDYPIGYGSSVMVNVGESRDLSLTGDIVIGGFVVATNGEDLIIDDIDTKDSNIFIRVDNISGGTITKNGVTVTEFTYVDVENGLIAFNHDGSSGQPTLTLSFSNHGVTWKNQTDVTIRVANADNVYSITQGGLFELNTVVPLSKTYLMEDLDKVFYADDPNTSFTNYGTIEAYGLGYLRPIYAVNIDHVTNYGIIETRPTNDNSATVYIENTGTLNNYGLIRSLYYGSSNDIVTIGAIAPDVLNTGTIYVVGQSSYGLLYNSGLNLNNSGAIYVAANESAIGVSAAFGTTSINNSGAIIAQDETEQSESIGIELNLTIATVINSGTIKADTAIIANYSLDLHNSGEIYGDIFATVYSNTIINTGNIYGKIDLGAAADIVDNTGGRIFGIVNAGAGTDILFGGANADFYYGGAGNDYITTGSGGADILGGGAGDDIFEAAHLSFNRISGDGGYDLLALTTDGTNLDFNNFDVSNISDMEEIYLGAIGVDLKINAEHVLAITDHNNILRIGGDGNDLLASDDSWTRGGDQLIGGINYRSYTSGDATLLVEDDVTFNATIIELLPSISINNTSNNEASEIATFTVSLSQASSNTVTVDYTAPDGSTGTLTFNPGDTEKTFTSTWTDDSTDEADEIVGATLSNPSNATISDGTGQLTIVDDDAAPTISIDDISANETDETDTFTVSLSSPSGKTVSVDYIAPDGSTGTLTFNPGDTEKTFNTSWTDDSADEADEIVVATLSNPSNATISDGAGQLTIVDDDAIPTISIDDISTNETDETDTFTVSLSSPSGKTVSVDYIAPDGSSGTLTFNPGDTEKTFNTSWTDDSTDEADEVVVATLSNPSNATIADGTGQLTILDDDGVNIIQGTSGDDLFSYTNRDDTLNNVYLGGDGTDTFKFSTFHVNDDRYTIDLSALNASDIEIIELGDNETWPGEELIFTAEDVISVTDANNTLRITGGSYDILTTSSTWIHETTIIENGEIYNIFTSGDATLQISPHIRTMNGILPTNDYTETSTRVFTANSDNDSFYRESTVSSSFLEIIGGDGDDIMVMYNLSDSLWGMGGDDYILAGWHNDFVNGGSGADTMDGGGNDANFFINDTLSYSGSSSAVNVNLLTGAASGGDAQGDQFSNFEDLEGSDHNDTLTGDATDNFIEGGAGADTMDGGDSSIYGDTLDYQGSSSGVTVNLLTASGVGGDAQGDIFINFENIRGSAFNDTLTGDGNDNILIGGGGEDTIFGGAGDDTIVSHVNDISASDSFDGGTGTDTLEIVSNGDVDLSLFDASNIEIIMLAQTPYWGNLENLTLTLQDVIDVTDADNELIIMGDGNDTITSTGEGWVQGANQDVAGETYNTFTAGGATLLVDADIIQDIS